MGPQPLLFHHSLDWRFLLPLADPKRIRVLLEEEGDLSRALQQVEIQPSQGLTLSDLRQPPNSEFQAVVMPLGLPVRWVTARHDEQVEFLASVRRKISLGGCLLVGFNNVWNLKTNSSGKYYPSTPRRISAQLEKAGFPSIKVFGAIPNLRIPEYILDLDSRTLQFALQTRFRRKRLILRALRMLSATVGMGSLSNYLPSYFVVAKV